MHTTQYLDIDACMHIYRYIESPCDAIYWLRGWVGR